MEIDFKSSPFTIPLRRFLIGGRVGKAGHQCKTDPGSLADRGEAFDFFFIDADKENNSAYVDWAVTLAMPGAVIVIDNIARMGRVLDPAPDDGQARAVHDMFVMMGEHPRLDTAAVQTVGTKGWDGFAVAVVGPES